MDRLPPLQPANNVLERDYQLKRAMGFALETFTRINRCSTASTKVLN